MNTYHIDLTLNQPILEQLNFHLKGGLTISNNEAVLSFNNITGKGKLQTTIFNRGVALYHFELFFLEDTKIICSTDDTCPISFIYLSKGYMHYSTDNLKSDATAIEQYQNVILRNKSKSHDIYILPKQTFIELTMVKVQPELFIETKKFEISSTDNSLEYIFKTTEKDLPIVHLGNFNLGLKDIVSQPVDTKMSSAVRLLNLESKAYRIVANQLSDYKKTLNQNRYPNFISKSDLVRLKAISEFISENINEFKTVAELCANYGYTQRKLQAMFRLYHGMSINSYVKTKKMEMARDLIENSNYSISEIVYQIGYKSRSYFSKLFFESYGILPIKYREKYKKQAQSFQRKKR